MEKRYDLTITQNTYAQMEIGETSRGSLNLSNGFLLKGKCDFDRLDKAVRKLYEKHDAMRMILKEDEKGLFFQFKESVPLGLNVVELKSEGRDERFAEANKDIREKVRLPLSADDTSMYRYWAYKISEEETLLFYVANHLATDGGSMAILNMELAKLYEDVDRTDLKESDSFAEFLLEKQRLTAEVLTNEERAYWRERIEGYCNPDMEKPEHIEEMTSMEYGRFTVALDKMNAISSKEKTSNFNVIFILIQLAAAELTGQRDIALRYAFANRFKKRFQNTIGFLTHGATLRHTFSDNETWSEIMNLQKETMNKDMKHLTFSDLVEVQEYLLSYIPASNGESSNKFGDLTIEPLVFHSRSSFGRRYVGLVAVEHDTNLYVTPYCDNNFYSREFILDLGKTINKYVNRITEYENPTVAQLMDK